MSAAVLDLPAAGSPGQPAPRAAAAGDQLPRRTAVMVLAGVLPLAAVALVLTWRHPAYRFFPLAWLGALWLLRRNWREMSSDLVPGTRVGTAVLLSGAWTLAAVATLLWSAWGGAVAALLAVVALTWWAGGWTAVRAFLPGLLVLALAVPPPVGLDFRSLGWLGAKSVSAASRLLHDLAVTHFLSGQRLEVPGLNLPVGSLTSLFNALPAAAAFAVFYAAALRRPLWRGLVMAPFAAGFALAAATLAVVYAVRASAGIKLDLFAGHRGWLLLLAVFAVAAVLVASLDQALQFLLSPVMVSRDGDASRVDSRGPGPQLTGRAPATGRGRWAGWTFLALGLVQLPLAGLNLRREFAGSEPVVSRLPASARFEPPRLAGWRWLAEAPLYLPLPLTNTTTRAVWYCESGDLAAAVVLDHPAPADADAVSGYANLGWRIAERRGHPGAPTAAGPWTSGLMQKDRGQVAGYWIATLEESGRWLPAESGETGLLTPFRGPDRRAARLRLLVLAVSADTLAAAELERLEGFFETVRQAVGRQFLAQLSPP